MQLVEIRTHCQMCQIFNEIENKSFFTYNWRRIHWGCTPLFTIFFISNFVLQDAKKIFCQCYQNYFRHLLIKLFILDPGLLDRVLSNRPFPCVRVSVCPCVRPSLSIIVTVHQFFLVFSMKLGHHKGTKVTEPDF